MNVSKSKLRQIIKEELNNILKEGLWDDWKEMYNSDEPEIRDTRDYNTRANKLSGGAPAYAAGTSVNPANREAALRAAATDPSLGLGAQKIDRAKASKWKEKQGGGAGRAQAGADWCTANKGRPLSAQQVISIAKSEGHYTGQDWYKRLPTSEPIYAQYKAWWKCAKPEDRKYLGPPRSGGGGGGGGGGGDLPEEWEVGKCVHDHPDYPGESVMANEQGEIVPCEEEAAGCENEDLMYDAMALYEAMKGMGTDEEAIYRVLEKNMDCECMKGLYAAYDKILLAKNDTDSGDLIDWLRDDGEYKSAAQVKKCMMGQDVNQIDTDWR